MMEYGCIGEKLSHSFSKLIHAELFDYDYTLCEIARERLDEFMKARAFRAINVTIPYKESVIPYLDYIDPAAEKIGAVNTVVNRDGRLYGYNTDFLGMKEMFRFEGISLTGKKVLVLGSGGTSKTAFCVAEDGGCRNVLRVSRSGRDGCITYEEAVSLHADAEVIINTTPSGMFPNIGESAISLESFGNLCGVADAVYNPLRSQLVCDAKKRGIPAAGGLYMLVAQAAFAAEKFTGLRVENEKIIATYKKLFRQKENIVLTGMPGCGKSTLGRAAAERLGMDFLDTDEEIVKRAGKTIPEIFAAEGERGFRTLESEVIADAAAKQHTVIATGGGAVLCERNIDLMRENGRIYFIDRPLEFLEIGKGRPLSQDKKALKKRYDERYSLYCQRCDRRIVPSQDKEENVGMIVKDFNYEDFGN